MSSEWKSPVRIYIGTGYPDIITGPVQAFEALNNRWPAEHGPQYKDAKRVCSMAVAGDVSPEIARQVFIAAAAEACILDQVSLPSKTGSVP